MSVVTHILGDTPSGFLEEGADMNNDGSVNITDVTILVNMILHGGKD